MADLERTYNIPLRKEWLKSPKYKRSKKAVTALKEFLLKHMKGNEVKIGKNLNKEVWKHGIKNPLHHVKVTAVKDDEGIVRAELTGFKYEEMTKEEMEKAEKEKPKKEETAEKKEEKAEEKKETSEKKEEKVEEKKEENKEALEKELKQGEQKIKQELSKLEKQTEDIKKEDK